MGRFIYALNDGELIYSDGCREMAWDPDKYEYQEEVYLIKELKTQFANLE